jgi:hypothetical protein
VNFGLKATINGLDYWCTNSFAWSADDSGAMRFSSADDAYRYLPQLGCDAVVDVLRDAKPEYWNPESEDFDDYCRSLALVRAEEDEMSEEVNT